MNRRRSGARTARGMTLVEVLVSLLIFSFGLLGLMGLQARALRFSTGAEDTNRAALLANEVAAQMLTRQTLALPAVQLDAWRARRRRPEGKRPSQRHRHGRGRQRHRLATITIVWRPPDGGQRSRQHRKPLCHAGQGSELMRPGALAASARRWLLAGRADGLDGDRSRADDGHQRGAGRSESSKRSTTSVNDINQTAAYVTYVMDRHLRSAGSGFAQRWSDAFGCILNAARPASPSCRAPRRSRARSRTQRSTLGWRRSCPGRRRKRRRRRRDPRRPDHGHGRHRRRPADRRCSSRPARSPAIRRQRQSAAAQHPGLPERRRRRARRLRRAAGLHDGAGRRPACCRRRRDDAVAARRRVLHRNRRRGRPRQLRRVDAMPSRSAARPPIRPSSSSMASATTAPCSATTCSSSPPPTSRCRSPTA